MNFKNSKKKYLVLADYKKSTYDVIRHRRQYIIPSFDGEDLNGNYESSNQSFLSYTNGTEAQKKSFILLATHE